MVIGMTFQVVLLPLRLREYHWTCYLSGSYSWRWMTLRHNLPIDGNSGSLRQPKVETHFQLGKFVLCCIIMLLISVLGVVEPLQIIFVFIISRHYLPSRSFTSNAIT